MKTETILARIFERSLWQGTYVDCRDMPRRRMIDLVDRGLLLMGVGGHYALTDEGRQCYESYLGRIDRPKTDDWKFEVLTGCREVKNKKTKTLCTEQTRIDFAALPTKSAQHETKTPEDICEELQVAIRLKDKLILRFGLSEEQVSIMFAHGRIKTCAHCNAIGVFDYQRMGVLKHHCRACANAWRKRNRKCDRDITI